MGNCSRHRDAKDIVITAVSNDKLELRLEFHIRCSRHRDAKDIVITAVSNDKLELRLEFHIRLSISWDSKASSWAQVLAIEAAILIPPIDAWCAWMKDTITAASADVRAEIVPHQVTFPILCWV
ncbi:hypothetical protein CEXT_331101 [Caerostris extrusa]|uniref:Uncharacterized protein n=1 Tax=Caerostris extrusa TaxID=172846 RepID=A0AAV4QP21_CAEEX|nr:hypothetical protein CEXT_331101 [Caerostris extrusa]